MKKSIGILLSIFMFGMISGCGSSNQTKKNTSVPVASKQDVKKEVKPSSDFKEKQAVLDTLKNIDESNKKISTTKDPLILKHAFKGKLGDGEILKDIIVDDKHITLKVNLGNKNSLEDLAKCRYGSLSESLLLNEYWTKITVNFIEVGNISMDTKDAIDDGNGKYFKSMEVDNSLEKN